MFVDFQNSYTVGRYLPTLCLWLDWHVFLAHSVLAHCVYFVLQQLISYILRLISDTIVSCLSSASRELRSGSNRTSPVESRSDAGCWSTCANWQRHKHSISDVAASVTSQHQWRRSISDVAASVTSQHQWRRSISDVTDERFKMLFNASLLMRLPPVNPLFNKCIGDDTKAAARQSIKCIENNKIKYGERRFSIWRMEVLHPAMWHDHDIDFARWLHPAMRHVALKSWQWIHQVPAPCNVIRGSGMTCHWICPVAAPCNVTRSSKIMTLNSPGDSILQCSRWLWDDTPLNLPKCPPYWNSTSGFAFYHITAVDRSPPSWILGVQ